MTWQINLYSRTRHWSIPWSLPSLICQDIQLHKQQSMGIGRVGDLHGGYRRHCLHMQIMTAHYSSLYYKTHELILPRIWNEIANSCGTSLIHGTSPKGILWFAQNGHHTLCQIKLEIHTDLRKIFRLIGDAFFSDCIAVEIQSSFFLAASISCDGKRIPLSILMINSQCDDTLAECYILKIDEL